MDVSGDDTCQLVADAVVSVAVSPVPFVLGSRYGRSPQRVMSARNDRFVARLLEGRETLTSGSISDRNMSLYFWVN